MRHTLELGLRHYTRADLEAVKAAGEKLHIKVLGLGARYAGRIETDSKSAVEGMSVYVGVHASKEIKSALADRIG